MKQFKIIFALCILSLGANAQLKSYDYFRELKPVTVDGYYQIKIGSAILDREGYYRVYEISAKDTTEVAYVTESYSWQFQDKKYFKDLRVIDKSYEKNTSYATLVVDTNINYTSVYLNFDGPQFFKDVVLEGSQDNKSWKIITEKEKLFRYLPTNEGAYLRNRIDFEPVSFKYLRVRIDDSESAKIDLLSASIPLIKQNIIEKGELLESSQNRIEDKKNKQTIIECIFPRAYSITDLEINIENEDPYHRDISVEFFNPVNGKEKWIFYGDGVVASNSKNRIYLSQESGSDFRFKSAKMRVLIHNKDDQPLGKIAIKPYTFQEEIRLKLQKEKKYVLVYGKQKDEQPSYDLNHFKSLIDVVSSVELGNEIKIPHAVAAVQKPLFNNKMWIWVALIICILLIGLFTFKLMKADPKQSE